ncbi:magnesium transporter CorA family protein [Solirubrobacter ginsenosidimutans]|uniref:Magnesium transporter CorA family protein n=1 Tax=Solirubrobacter ginsenosidimutans TaxID=490573 RepID=A0A9X3MYG9_9ACTN|nr:magnesium transporter CorA family protein [Solirubrobacter ginsenosidimutans]MDA0161768.1 magnesium transporter CorA family protein [Solirubrobacter ginsenosidimutans]
MHVLTEVDPELIAQLRKADHFFWIDLDRPDPGAVRQLGAALDLHPVALEDTLEMGQRPKIEPYQGHVLLVFYTARATGGLDRPGEPQEVHIYISGEFIATVHPEPCQALVDLHASLAEEPTHDEEILIYRVLDGLTDAFYPVISAVEGQIDTLEVEILTRPKREHLGRSYRLKQNVRELQRLTAAQHEQFKTAHEFILALEGLTKGSRPYLRDIGDHLIQITGEFQRQLDDLFALTQTYFNANSDRLNAVASRLTVGGTIFVTYTVVTGFFGQNFGWLVDHIDSKHAFLTFGVGSLVVPTVVLLTLFWIKRHDWF